MNLVKLMYRYINKFINSDDLLKELTKINLLEYSDDEQEIIKELIQNIKKIKDKYFSKVDKTEENHIKNMDKMIDIFKQINDKNDDEDMKIFKNNYNNLLKEKQKVRDSGELYIKIFEILTNNVLINKYAKKMNDIELLEFITEYISVPLPPELDQEGFNALVLAGINEDKRESLWRLAFNYNQKNKDFSLIENYFIEKKDDYYLVELINVVKEDLNMDDLINKIIESKDKKFISEIAEDCKKRNIINEEMYNKLKNNS